jgi:DNA-binding CsgD family transcriptional regulator
MMPREKLTPKEVQIAVLVWQGLTNREIGKVVGTSEQVIKNHLRSTFDKLGVWSRLELAMYVASHGSKNWPTAVEVGEIRVPQIGEGSTSERSPHSLGA